MFVSVEANKVEIVKQGAVSPLLGVARSHDPRVQRNATGALLNLTHIGKTPPFPSLSLLPCYIAYLSFKEAVFVRFSEQSCESCVWL